MGHLDVVRHLGTPQVLQGGVVQVGAGHGCEAAAHRVGEGQPRGVEGNKAAQPLQHLLRAFSEGTGRVGDLGQFQAPRLLHRSPRAAASAQAGCLFWRVPTPDPSAPTATAKDQVLLPVTVTRSRSGPRSCLSVLGVRPAPGAVPWWFVELRQLRYFLAVAEEGRFSRAAQRLHIAAPSLSQQIQALERELRVPLFDRTPQRVELTIAGQALAGRARVILAEVERARAEVHAAESGRERVSLRVANMADLVLDGTLRRLGQGIDGVEVSVSSSRGDDALDAVRQSRADAAVVWSRRPTDRDLDGVVLGSVVFGAGVPLGPRAAASGRVPVAALAGEILVMFPRGPFAGVWDR